MNISKYNASGNDFVIFHTFDKIDRSELAKKLCHRQKGIGADGLIVILPNSIYDFEWQFYNSDGSEASMCGNGSRAAAHYAVINNLANEKLQFLTDAGVIFATVENDDVEIKLSKADIVEDVIVEKGFKWQLIDTGVPHLVTFVDDLKLFSKTVAKEMRDKYDANVNFAKIVDKSIEVRTYERGVEDETLACGTGMAACFYGALKNSYVDSEAKVYPASQDELILSLKGADIYFKGKVNHVFTAQFLEKI